ncbi:hypothetical protein Glove_290g100 [Diversispora epigaea]|uniref:Uncharacterized protein n=1 Tax=Diversispora epigaea TaxID=1348612 RepID=A0A397I6S7_9GLOM|nr:hypothetical protein Glove_290g100 [Diversispora epigaea]
MSGKFAYEENSAYLKEGVLVIIDKAKRILPPPGTHTLTFIAQLPILLHQITKYNHKIEFFIEACSFDLLSVRATPTLPQKSGNVIRTAPRDDIENYILKKYQSEQSPKRQRTNHDDTAEIFHETLKSILYMEACSFDLLSVRATPTLPQKSGNVIRTAPRDDIENYILKKYQSEHIPITPTFPIEFISSTHDVTPDTSASLSQPSLTNINSLNKITFQAINHNPNKKISEDFHNLDPSSFISFTKKKGVTTATNTGSVQNISSTQSTNSIQNIALNKLQEEKTDSPEDLINEG